MEMLEKVELVHEKCNISYGQAKEALEASGGDVLDAIVWLERRGKAQTTSVRYETAQGQDSASVSTLARVSHEHRERAHGQEGHGEGERKDPRTSTPLGQFMEWLRRTCRSGLDATFIAERHDERVLAIPVLILVILVLFVWPAALPLLVVGLFFCFRYHFEGVATVSVDINEAMDRAADGAESLKRDLTRH